MKPGDTAGLSPRTARDLAVTRLGFGGAPLGNLYRRVSEEDAQATLRAAFDCGVRFFDTAPFYGLGRSEERFGTAIERFGRENVVLSTKIGRLIVDCAADEAEETIFVDALQRKVVFDYGYDGVMRSHEASLARLLELGDFDCFLLAGRYTLLEQEALASFLPACVERDVGIILGGPFNSGILATGATDGARFNYAPAPPDIVAQVRRIEAVCATHGVTLAAAALQFVLSHSAVRSVIPGALAAHEVRQNAAVLEAPIPAAFWAELKAERLLHDAAPVPAA